MPKFLKSPRFIIGAIVALWLAYVIYANFQLAPIKVSLLPSVTVEFRVSAVMIGAIIFGSLVTLAIQFLWKKRRSSKNASTSAAA